MSMSLPWQNENPASPRNISSGTFSNAALPPTFAAAQQQLHQTSNQAISHDDLLLQIACARTMVMPWLLLVVEGWFVFALFVSFSCFGYVTSFAGCPLLLAGPWLEPPVHGTHGPKPRARPGPQPPLPRVPVPGLALLVHRAPGLVALRAPPSPSPVRFLRIVVPPSPPS